MRQLVQKLKRQGYRLLGTIVGARSHQRVQRAPLDPGITYPSYKSLDEFIDVERLQKLDGVLREQILEHARSAATKPFDSGFSKMRILDKQQPGGRVIELAEQIDGDYFDLNKPECWRPSEHAARFPELMEFIATLPFKATARIVILYDEQGRAVTPHRDHTAIAWCHEFFWLRTTCDKPFFLLDNDKRRKAYVEGHSAWFDTVNQYHGADATGEFCFSIRVDGEFDDAFRARIPTPTCNAASQASLWAGQS